MGFGGDICGLYELFLGDIYGRVGVFYLI